MHGWPKSDLNVPYNRILNIAILDNCSQTSELELNMIGALKSSRRAEMSLRIYVIGLYIIVRRDFENCRAARAARIESVLARLH